MTIVETAVADLAEAIEKLESKLERRIYNQSATNDDYENACRQARTARGHASEASRGLAKSINDLKSMLGETGPNDKE